VDECCADCPHVLVIASDMGSATTAPVSKAN
jgi:hypothetical protein